MKKVNKKIRPYLERYLIKIGRRWYIESIYKSLMESRLIDDQKFAKETFNKAKKGYHYISKNTIEKIVN